MPAWQHLHVQAVVHHLGVGHHHGLVGVRDGETRKHPLVHHRRHVVEQGLHPAAGRLGLGLAAPAVQARHVGAAHLPGQSPQDGSPRGSLGAQPPNEGQRLGQLLLPLAHQNHVEEGGIGLGVIGARTAGQHDGITLGPLVAVQRDAGQIQRLQDVGGRQLVGQRDAHRIELGHRGAALQGEQRHAPIAHEVGHVHGRQEGPLGPHALGGVHRVHQNAHGLVRLAQLVGVRIDHAELEGGVVLHDAAPLVVQIAGRPLDASEQRLHLRPEVSAWHGLPFRSCRAGRAT